MLCRGPHSDQITPRSLGRVTTADSLALCGHAVTSTSPGELLGLSCHELSYHYCVHVSNVGKDILPGTMTILSC